MPIKFLANDHKYVSIDANNSINWTSVTSIISKYKKPFDAEIIAEKSAKNKKSKWYGMTPDAIKDAWKNESAKAVNLGTWYHNQREKDLLACNTIKINDIDIPIIRPITEDNFKIAPAQKLENGIYPEHLVYLKSAGICGQADRVEVINGIVDIYDYKTNKEIKSTGYVNWEGISDKMLPPLQHLDDCNLNHYNIQLSLYMYIILKHNPKLKPGKLVVEHIQFKEAGKDAYDNRVVFYDDRGEPIVEKIIQYHLPYLKNEIITIINTIKNDCSTKPNDSN